MAARGRKGPNPNPNPVSGSADLAGRRLTPVDSTALVDLSAKVDRLLAMETASAYYPPGEAGVAELLRTEVQAAVADLTRQLHGVVDGVVERLADDTAGLRGGLQLALEEAQRRQAQDNETLRAGVQAAFNEIVRRQAEDREAMQAQLRAAMADSRDHVRSELQALATLVADRTGGQQQLRSALDAMADAKLRPELAEQRRQLVEEFEALRAAIAPAPRDARRQLLAELDAVLTPRDERLAAMITQQGEAINVQVREAVEASTRQQAVGWEARRAELEAALADGNDQLKQALAEENARLRALEATLVGQATQTRMQFRADLEAALTAGRDVGLALVAQAIDRMTTLGDEVAASIAKTADERSREQAEQLNDLQAAFEDLTSAIGLERRELRAAVEEGLDTADLVERIDGLTASTAKGAASVAAAIEKLRRQPRTESRVNDMLMELYEELERLRRKVPTKSELRLADDQMAAILAAVKGARPRPATPAAPPAKRTPPVKRTSR